MLRLFGVMYVILDALLIVTTTTTTKTDVPKCNFFLPLFFSFASKRRKKKRLYASKQKTWRLTGAMISLFFFPFQRACFSRVVKAVQVYKVRSAQLFFFFVCVCEVLLQGMKLCRCENFSFFLSVARGCVDP